MSESVISDLITKKELNLSKNVPRFGVRYTQVLLLFSLLAIGMGTRVSLSVAIVAMTDNTTTTNPDVPTYNWTNKSVILSSFYWTYCLLQIVAAILGRTRGPKYILVGSMSTNTIAFLSIPFVAKTFGSFGVMGCRMVQGLSQSFFYPSVFNLLGQWAPASERTRMGSVTSVGGSLGVIVAMPLTGVICSTWLGWPLLFYLYSLLAVTWIVLWILYGSNSPADHRSISLAEKRYIQQSEQESKPVELKDIPWKAILTSMPLCAITVVFIGSVMIMTLLSTELPIYMHKVMGFDVKSGGFMSCLPDLATFSMTFLVAPFADFLINKNYLSVGNTRKLFTFFALIPYAASVLILTSIPNNSVNIAISLLILNGILGSFSVCGSGINHVDLSPRYSGIIMSISNSISMIFAFISPLIVQFVVTDETNRSQWQTVFIIAAVACVASVIFYVIFASGEVQWWNSSTSERSEQKLEGILVGSLISLSMNK